MKYNKHIEALKKVKKRLEEDGPENHEGICVYLWEVCPQLYVVDEILELMRIMNPEHGNTAWYWFKFDEDGYKCRVAIVDVLIAGYVKLNIGTKPESWFDKFLQWINN